MMGVIRTSDTAGLEDSVVDRLRDLVQVNIDSAEGFRNAAEAIDDKTLASDFRVWAADRTRQADDLARYVEMNDESAPEERSWGAALHQTWLDLRAAVSAGDAHAVLAEAERGEDHIKSMYEEVLKDTAGSGVNDVLQRQYKSVKGVHDRVRDLRDARE
jgi:uncharacterized protein (TIGR02284 family)